MAPRRSERVRKQLEMEDKEQSTTPRGTRYKQVAPPSASTILERISTPRKKKDEDNSTRRQDNRVSTRCHLLELPAELRNQIYELVLTGTLRYRLRRGYSRRSVVSFLAPALLCTCKAIYQEALGIYYSAATFELRSVGYLSKWMGRIRPDYLKLVITVHLGRYEDIPEHLVHRASRLRNKIRDVKQYLQLGEDVLSEDVIKSNDSSERITRSTTLLESLMVHKRLAEHLAECVEASLKEQGEIIMYH
ncbi:hypothetical protein CLAFUW4_13743 [Fulvia fulva]|nr:hypothetical protein CLAFUR4_13746 [Fulvia fulva]KAK4610907.1 hypothetical protein CLAFUR0_13750 [Fulvia fulva]WPV21763.1 hypothetical protein CLAFUW4_13743 [Fulvia fulva]WPV36922.1 hypothetical protein CLAFUW7_13751 [Fulvia fulva]